jgi:hypothetical protein
VHIFKNVLGQGYYLLANLATKIVKLELNHQIITWIMVIESNGYS